MSLLKHLKKIKDKGFTLIEVLISMGLLAFVMGISMNVLSIVLEMTDDADFSVTVTQESEYATEDVKRLVRSADSFSVDSSGVLTVNIGPATHRFQFVQNTNLVPGSTVYVLQKNGSSVMSSEVYCDAVTGIPFFQIIQSNGETVGVQMAFQTYHIHDTNKSAGSIIYSQALGRNITLNW